jgi:hypothetical protein
MTVEVLLEQYGRMASQVTLLPRGIKAKDFLGMVMRGEIQATPQQIRAAENLLTIEEPKRKAEGRNYEEEFPYKLEEALRRRSERAKQVNPIIEGTVIKDAGEGNNNSSE